MSYRSPKRYIVETNYHVQTPPVIKSPGYITSPLIQQSLHDLSGKQSFNKLQKRFSIKDVFQNRKQNLSLDELSQDKGYRVYYLIFRKILWLLMILGLWAPKGNGWRNWGLRVIYPKFIYFLILYPWTTFLTQSAYNSIPVFLFMNLHLSGLFAYRSARLYWQENHLVKFLTSTFIPFYDELFEFERIHRHKSSPLDNVSSDEDIEYSNNTTLQMGFRQRYRNETHKRKKRLYHDFFNFDINTKKKKSRSKSTHNNYVINIDDDNAGDSFLQVSLQDSLNKLGKDGSDPFMQKEENITSWATIAGSENHLSLSLFYEATQRMWWRFWSFSALVGLPIIVLLLFEIVAPWSGVQSSISTNTNKLFKDKGFKDIFIPFNTTITFIRIFYNICEFVFMAFYFQFMCECHRGDLNIHLHYYDTSDIQQQQSDVSLHNNPILQYYQELEFRLASIVWDWDRIVSSIRDTSKAFRWWLVVMIIFNLMAGVTAAINLSTNSLDTKHPKYPQHLEMYLPALTNLIISFFILLIGAKVSHLNTIVRRRTYFLLANTHFSHMEITSIPAQNDDIKNNNDNNNIQSFTNNYNDNESNVVINIEDIEDINNDLDVDTTDDDMDDMDDNNNNDKAGDNSKRNQFYFDFNGLELKKQNLYIQAQTVANATTNRQIGISVYGLILNRRLFLAFFSPFVAFFLFCINTYLPK